MPFATQEKTEILQLVKSELPEMLREVLPIPKPNWNYEMEMRERIVRVEEELKHQRELMIEGFKRMDERFEAVDKRFEAVDKRFEAVDKRFEAVDKRFEAVDKRFEDLRHYMDKRFSLLQWTILSGFAFVSFFLGILTYLARIGFFTP